MRLKRIVTLWGKTSAVVIRARPVSDRELLAQAIEKFVSLLHFFTVILGELIKYLFCCKKSRLILQKQRSSFHRFMNIYGSWYAQI